jgi:hypothetical protein
MDWKTLGLEIVRRAWSWSPALKTVVPIVISVIALWISLRDRRPRLTLKARSGGEWYKLKPTEMRDQVAFMGIIEVYNVSSRANAIRDYRFLCKCEGGWREMESALYSSPVGDGSKEISNPTPFTLAPYSGAEVRVLAFTPKPQPYEMEVMIEVADLFGKTYHVIVKAVS